MERPLSGHYQQLLSELGIVANQKILRLAEMLTPIGEIPQEVQDLATELGLYQENDDAFSLTNRVLQMVHFVESQGQIDAYTGKVKQ